MSIPKWSHGVAYYIVGMSEYVLRMKSSDVYTAYMEVRGKKGVNYHKIESALGSSSGVFSDPTPELLKQFLLCEQEGKFMNMVEPVIIDSYSIF